MDIIKCGRKWFTCLAIAAILAGVVLVGPAGAATTFTGDIVTQGPWVDPRACNNSLERAVALAETNGTGVRIWSSVNLTSSISTTASITVEPGGKIVQTGSYSLAIDGPFNAGLHQVFSGFSAGQITFTRVEGIRPEWGGGTDTEQMQFAADVATASAGVPIFVSRKMTLTSAVNINRNSVVGKYRIIGTGKDGGFYTASEISMFSTALTPSPATTGAPIVAMVSFENIRFEASSPTLNCFAVDGNAFYKIFFTGCFFQDIRLAYTENYFQSWYLTGCSFRAPAGWIMQAVTTGVSVADGLALDVHVHNCNVEGVNAGSSGFLKTSNGSAGCSFIGNLYESLYGAFYDVPCTMGGVIQGNYFEGNINASTGHGGPTIKLGQGTTISITGNHFNLAYSGDGTANTVYADSWAIRLVLTALPTSGKDVKIFSSGNSSKGNFFNNSEVATFSTVNPMIISQGDGLWNQYTDAALFSDPLEVNQETSRTVKVTLADDTATSVKVGVFGTVQFSGQYSTVNGTMAYRTDASAHLVDIGTRGAHVVLSTGALTGTTGTDGKFTVSAGTDGKLYFENRIGTTVIIVFTVNYY